MHDLAESIVGDITPHCGVSLTDKKEREDKAMQEILKDLPSSLRDKVHFPYFSCMHCGGSMKIKVHLKVN